jgi:transposase
MARSHRVRYTAEFKAEALSRVQHSDRPIRHIAKELGVTATTLHRWLAVARPAPVERLTADERTELLTLRRDVQQLRQERDILKKATAFFAKQSE